MGGAPTWQQRAQVVTDTGAHSFYYCVRVSAEKLVKLVICCPLHQLSGLEYMTGNIKPSQCALFQLNEATTQT